MYVKDELFATLDTTTRNVWLEYGKEVLVTDTVGFINNLPHEFVEAFASTLEESIYADLILHVVDINNPEYQKHIDVTNSVLGKLGCNASQVMIFNKCDKASDDRIQEIKSKFPTAIYISAKTNRGIQELKDKIMSQLF